MASVRRTIHRLLTRRLSKRTDKPFMQMLALKVIARGEVGSQSALAEQLMVDPPAVSRLVDRLVEEGLLTRGAGEDRRCVRLEVTPEGRGEVDLLHAELRRLETDVRKHLTAQEAKTLQQLLEKLQAGLMETGDDAQEEQEE
ncbi:MarR family winged helix-turn-helix transcriptional regulator [Hyalangium sp.]|uniref:MarR family winged helix-turn-helix transcriptional regulator n=1 Tax=Hyalangium sp. TaxID=2028555 RepID=UPI002D2D3652|nr:MarR family transcriptional regulator [Hyalangium sp.]HYH98386.1 MarR family transcriptional regulator [Hyalangium sp.]